ncbi:hypothetical protein EJ03DRAFT_330333 [Teratosphaeria nubilosa]|uniref:Uncharacterized protein n=1 Tax=Teratosphaeria nubilosa TaxID=161662 RepID=A0A6G1L1Q3_9PEZI|nr:hypothetical protein EJ03DRAFT_330333 [Teratosphaeria nubilosa]
MGTLTKLEADFYCSAADTYQCSAQDAQGNIERRGFLTSGWTNLCCQTVGGVLSGQGDGKCCTVSANKYYQFVETCNKQKRAPYAGRYASC